jgi:hypothetical protein
MHPTLKVQPEIDTLSQGESKPRTRADYGNDNRQFPA